MIPKIDVPQTEDQLTHLVTSGISISGSNNMTNNSAAVGRDSDGSAQELDGNTDELDEVGVQNLIKTSRQTKRKSLTKLKLELPEVNDDLMVPKLIEKSVIVHKDENGFGLRVKGQAPVFVEHVHENGAAWRAGVRRFDVLSKINGTLVTNMDHKDVVLMFKSCTRFVGLTLLSTSNSSHSANPQATPIQLTIQNRTSAEDNDGGGGDDDDNTGDDLTSLVSHQTGSASLLTLQQIRSASQGASPSASRLLPRGLVSLAQATACGTTLNTGSDNHLTVIQSNTNQLNSNSCGQLTSSQAPNSSPRRDASRIILLKTNGRNESDSTSQVCLACRSTLSPWSSQSGYCDDCYSRTPANRSTENKPTEATGARQQLSPTSAAASRQTKHLSRQPTAKHEAPEGEQLASGRLAQSASASSLPGDAVTSSAAANTSNVNVGRYHPIALTGMGNPVPPRAVDANGKPQVNKRLEIVREFIDTEKTHTERLRYLDELFYRPLKTGNMMTSEQLRQVFSCHRTLYKIHRQIYRILLSANYNVNAEPLVGSALLEIFEGDLKRRLEKAACVFCSAQSTNAELLNKLTRRDTKVGEFIAQVTSQQMIGRLGIKDLLASCFQRLTKYPLLLENLLKATPKPSATNSTELDRFLNNELHRSPHSDSHEFLDHLGEEEYDHQQNELELEMARNSRRMLAISLEEEREFIQRALKQSREILVKVNDSVKVAISQNKLKEIWKRTDKYPGVPLIDITKQQVVHEGLLTLRLSKRSFDVYVLLLNDYIIILTREGQDKYRLKFFTPDGKSAMTSSSLTGANTNQQTVYSPVFVIDEHLTTRDAATDENGFYLLCKRKDDSRIYEFASRSPAERMKWRDRIQWTIERQMSKGDRRPSCISTITKSSSEISGKRDLDDPELDFVPSTSGGQAPIGPDKTTTTTTTATNNDRQEGEESGKAESGNPSPSRKSSGKPEKIEGTISYVEDDGIVLPSNMASTRALVDQAVQVSIFADTRTNWKEFASNQKQLI